LRVREILGGVPFKAWSRDDWVSLYQSIPGLHLFDVRDAILPARTVAPPDYVDAVSEQVARTPEQAAVIKQRLTEFSEVFSENNTLLRYCLLTSRAH
jgi:hypothetical protein